MTLRQWLFSRPPLATNITTSNLRSSDGVAASLLSLGGGTAVYDDLAHVGTSGLLTNANNANMALRLAFAGTASNAAALEMYSRAATLPAATYIFASARQASGVLFRFGITSAGALVIQTRTGAAVANTADGRWAVNRQNRIAIFFNNSGGDGAGTLTAEIYDGDSLTPLETLSVTGATLGSQAVASIDLGCILTTSAPWAHYVDSVQMDDGRTSFIGPYIPESRSVDLTGSGTLSAEGVLARHIRAVALSGSGSLAGAAFQRSSRSVGLSGAGTLSATAQPLPFPVALSGSGTLAAKNVKGTVNPPVTFSYWEKRSRNFGPSADARRRDLMPFYMEPYAQGVTVVQMPDGSFTPVHVVTEELEALEGVRIFWGGKDNVVTEDEAIALNAAGYGDYLSTAIITPDDAFGAGLYGEGDYGA